MPAMPAAVSMMLIVSAPTLVSVKMPTLTVLFVALVVLGRRLLLARLAVIRCR
jgi:hypothetical protein